MALTLAQAIAAKGAVDAVEIPFVRYCLRFRVREPVALPEYSGSTLRGAFGRALRRASCMLRRKDCKSCPLYRSCPYTMLFETPPPAEHSLQRFSQVPNPFVIEPPAWGLKSYLPGEELLFNIVLCGQAINYLSLVIYAWKNAFDREVGHGKADLCDVLQVSEEGEASIYDVVGDNLAPHKKSTTVSVPTGPDRVLALETPLRLQDNGQAVTPEAFDVHRMFMAMVRRIALLHEFHCGEALPLDFVQISEHAGFIDSRADLQWLDWVRFSSRQQRRMHFGGVSGTLELANVPPIFNLLIAVASYSHIGKNATFGLGKIHLTR